MIIVSYLIRSHIKAVLTKALVANANDLRERAGVITGQREQRG